MQNRVKNHHVRVLPLLSESEGFGGGGPRPKGGGGNSTKIESRRDLKLHIFSAKGAENFERIKVFKEKCAFFGILRENLA